MQYGIQTLNMNGGEWNHNVELYHACKSIIGTCKCEVRLHDINS